MANVITIVLTSPAAASTLDVTTLTAIAREAAQHVDRALAQSVPTVVTSVTSA